MTLAAAVAVAAWSATGMADDLARQWISPPTAASSGGQPEQKLKWFPYRPSPVRSVTRAALAEPAVRRGVRNPLRSARSVAYVDSPSARQRPRGAAFEDPFKETVVTPRRPALAAVQPDSDAGEVGMPSPEPPVVPLPEVPSLRPAPSEPPPEAPSRQMPAIVPESVFGRVPTTTLDRPLQEDRLEEIEECPSPDDPDYHTRIGDLSTDTSAEPGEFPQECMLTDETIRPFALGKVRDGGQGEIWAPITFTWKASALCHKPLYFEEKHLERYGQSWGPLLQPVASGAHFFLTVPVLPYKMGLYPPRECMYTLGYYRPGSCAPRMLDPLPLSLRAALAEGSVWTGMAFVIP